MGSSRVAYRVVVGLTGSLANLAALHAAVREARTWRCPLTAVTVVPAPTGRHSTAAADALAHEAAARSVATAFRDAFGGMPADVDVTACLASGPIGRALVAAASGPADLLVVGASRRLSARISRRTVADYCRRHARDVVVVPRPELLQELGQVEHIRDLDGLIAI